MKLASLLLAALLAFVACAPSSAARAQATHHQTLAYGDRSLGLGGAFTGLASDQGAAWYNPAGLAFLSQNSVSGSLLLHSFETVERGRGDLRLETTRRATFPLFATGVVGLGPRDARGRHRHAIGIAVLRPHQLRRRLGGEAIDAATGAPSSILIDRTHHHTWFGPSFGSRIGENFSFGATLFAAINTFEHREVLLRGAAGTSAAEIRSALSEVKAFHLVARLGALYRTDRFGVGLMLQPPGIPLAQHGIVSEQRSLPGRPDFFGERDHTKAYLPMPGIARVGLSYRLPRNVLLAGDLQFVAPVRSRAVLDIPAPGDESPNEPAAAGHFDLDAARDAVANAALGVEWPASRKLLLRFGAYTDRSTARSLPMLSDRYAEPDIDSLGLTASIGTLIGIAQLNIGVAGVGGRGHALILDPRDGLGDPVYRRAPASRRILYFFITGRIERPEEGEDEEERTVGSAYE